MRIVGKDKKIITRRVRKIKGGVREENRRSD